MRQLRYFAAVAEELNFRAAAKRLFITQPPLSRQVAKLEEELGVQLLSRNTHGVRLTEAGQQFYKSTTNILEQLEEAKHAISGLSNKKLRINMVVSGIVPRLPSFNKRISELFPGIDIEVQEIAGGQMAVQNLIQNTSDVAFYFGMELHEDLELEVLLQDQVMLALPEGHRLAAFDRVPLAELTNEPIIIFPRSIDPKSYDRFIAACARFGFKPNIVQHTYPQQTRLNLVAAGLGLTFVAEGVAAMGYQNTVFRMPEAAAQEHIPLVMSWRKADSSAATQALVQLVRQEFAHSTGFPIGPR